jgi:cytochrome c oxidase assembly protein subunit 15
VNPFRRAWQSLTSARGFRTLALVSMALLWVIFPSGGLVRLTGSGLGCSDWPLCNAGGIVPASNHHAWIEFSNRMFSGVVIVVVVLLAIAAFAAVGTTTATRVGALVAAVATVGQVPLGAVTVLFDLHPLLVASHFVLSLIALAGGVVAYLQAADVVHGVRRAFARGATWLAALFTAALGTAVVTGVLVTSAGPHSGDPKVIKRFGMLDHAAYVHVRAVVALLIVAIIVGVAVWRRRTDRGLVVPALWFVPFFIAQVVVGEVQWHNQLPWQVVLAHVTIAGVVWGLGVTVAWRLARPITGATGS